jgi:hypothetical protein
LFPHTKIFAGNYPTHFVFLCVFLASLVFPQGENISKKRENKREISSPPTCPPAASMASNDYRGHEFGPVNSFFFKVYVSPSNFSISSGTDINVYSFEKLYRFLRRVVFTFKEKRPSSFICDSGSFFLCRNLKQSHAVSGTLKPQFADLQL